MSELVTIARPYARAIFDMAQAQNRLAEWSDMLEFMSAVVGDSSLEVVLKNPRLSTDQAADLFNSVCEGQIDGNAKNLVRLLAENRKLVILPKIKILYEKYRADAEGKVDAEIISAQDVNDKQLSALASALKLRLGREVTLSTRTDPELIGGAIIRAGDLVIDGSIQGKLNKLSNVLTR